MSSSSISPTKIREKLQASPNNKIAKKGSAINALDLRQSFDIINYKSAATTGSGLERLIHNPNSSPK